MEKQLTFQDLPVGARFYLDSKWDHEDYAEGLEKDVMVKTSDEGYEVEKYEGGVHGDADPDYPVALVE